MPQLFSTNQRVRGYLASNPLILFSCEGSKPPLMNFHQAVITGQDLNLQPSGYERYSYNPRYYQLTPANPQSPLKRLLLQHRLAHDSKR
jgi:hypothetical protein